MYEPIETIAFNVFDYANAHEWKAAKAQFYSDNEDIKAATRELIDTSFRKLRSAEGACELLQSFKSIKSKGAIQKQVMNKFNDILEQFAREIEQTAEIFEKNKDAPPVTKNQPPVAGAIKWVRSLLERLKRTMAKLLSTEEVGPAIRDLLRCGARSGARLRVRVDGSAARVGEKAGRRWTGGGRLLFFSRFRESSWR
jgi:dynein heavy chain